MHPPVVLAHAQSALRTVLHPDVGLVLWPRRLHASITDAPAPLMQGQPFCAEAAGTPVDAAGGVLTGLPAAAQALRADIEQLAQAFAALCGTTAVHIRLEHSRKAVCPKLHVDAIGLRLLCTYAGRGTEWQGADGALRRMKICEVGMFKGAAWPDRSLRTPHRSPAVSHLPATERGRVLLCIDQIGDA